jgi:Protein of unknown function (DUF3558)
MIPPTTLRRTATLVLGLIAFGVIAVLLAGCGGDSTSSTNSSPPAANSTSTTPKSTNDSANKTAAVQDPCSLLTQAEVETAVGQPLGVGKQVLTLDDCQWTTSDFTAGVDVTVSDWTAIKNAATTNGTKVAPSVSGIGDEALNLNGSNGSLLYVRKGDQGFLLTINGPHIDGTPDHGLAQEEVLAKAVLGRLK